MGTTTALSLELSATELDALYGASPAGDIPQGRGRGTAVYHAGSRAAKPLATVVRLGMWQGKLFRPQSHDLVNLLTPLSIPGLRADVYEGTSWYDQKPCIVIDYSKSKGKVQRIRDEIRQVGPGEYLGIVFDGTRKLGVHFFLRFGG